LDANLVPSLFNSTMNDPVETYQPFELLTTEEYLKRLQVGRATLYKWRNSGILIPGKHFIQQDKVVRYIWDLETIRSLHKNVTPDSDSMNLESDYLIEKKKDSTRKSVIDLNY